MPEDGFVAVVVLCVYFRISRQRSPSLLIMIARRVEGQREYQSLYAPRITRHTHTSQSEQPLFHLIRAKRGLLILVTLFFYIIYIPCEWPQTNILNLMLILKLGNIDKLLLYICFIVIIIIICLVILFNKKNLIATHIDNTCVSLISQNILMSMKVNFSSLYTMLSDKHT